MLFMVFNQNDYIVIIVIFDDISYLELIMSYEL